MSKPITKAFWIGKAAYEIGLSTGCDGAVAHLEAIRMADDLSAYRIDLAHVEPREYARGLHGDRVPAFHVANDNGEAKRMYISLWGDSYIYQLDIYEEGAPDPLEVRVPIDFLRGVREARDGVAWRDAFGSTIVRVGNTTVMGLAGRRGETAARLELDDLNLMHLELALSKALNNNYEHEECSGFTGAWVSLAQRRIEARQAA